MALHHALHTAAPALPEPARVADGDAAAVELYRRTYLTLLRSTGETRLRVLESSHRAMHSSLHPLADSHEPDLGAFLYAIRRLPDSIAETQLIVMGQSTEVFARSGFVFDATAQPGHLHATAPPAGGDGGGARPAHGADGDGDGAGPGGPGWVAVEAPGRRRRWYHDEAGTLAVLVASASDIDDLIPTLVAFQIEWNKLGVRLRAAGAGRGRDLPGPDACATAVGGSADDWAQVGEIWGEAFGERLLGMATHRLSLRVRMLGGSQVGYARVTRGWWDPVRRLLADEGLDGRPVYFVSSNPHSLVNLVTDVVREREEEIVGWVDDHGPPELVDELRRFREGRAQGEWANFVYYAARPWLRALGLES
ncbi:MAG TPA: hypothetical protein VFO60_08115, partial [Candidatus Dormibacteraeota bacterium]|nr:hypothetical protein [Candidatus Dormibacteraeota bacterium]